MRLIDADAKIMAQLYDDEHEDWVQKEMTVADYLSFSDTAIPFVDAVPVVRCRECRYHEDEQPGMVYCPATVGGWVENDWFCKGGEREEGADNG